VDPFGPHSARRAEVEAAVGPAAAAARAGPRALQLEAQDLLAVALGHSSLAGPRPRNEDFCGAATPADAAELASKGIVAAVADGVGGHPSGHEASEHAVRNLLADYYATPDTLAVPHALERVLVALNRWLHDYGRRTGENDGRATTLSAIVLRGTRYFTAHVGDSRIYLVRAGAVQRLTCDHVWDHPELRHVLKRAVGLDHHVMVDYGDGQLQAGDAFALVTDGVWSAVDDDLLARIVGTEAEPDTAAAALTRAALERGASDNVTALVVRVTRMPRVSLRDVLVADIKLPLPPRLRVGDELDGLVVEAVLHESRVTLLYRVRRSNGAADPAIETLVLKTLRPDADAEASAALIHEEWLARRVTSHYFPQVVAYPGRAHLYYLMDWHAGATLAQRLAAGHRYAPAEAVRLGIRLLKGVGALHRLSIVHRDIKPENLHLGADGRLRILDLGVAASDGVDFAEINNPGTPSYMAPELFDGEPATESSDLYACGVTLYHLLTRRFPYREVEPFQHPRFGDPMPPHRFRPDIPAWLEAVLMKACARESKDRFETADEFLLALERGAARPLAPARPTPLASRAHGFGLRLLAAASLLANLVLVLLLLARRAG